MIDLVDREEDRLLVLIDVVPHQFGTYFHAVLGINHHHTRVRYTQGGYHFPGEVVKSRGIDNINFVIAPFGVHDGSKDGVTPLLLDFVIITHGVFAFDGPPAADDAGFKDHVFRQQCLS